MANSTFIMIPVPMIRRLAETPNAYTELLSYGLYNSARKQRTSFVSGALKQMIYCYYRDKRSLTAYLRKWLEEHEGEEWWPDEDYNGFNGDEFNPEYEEDFLYDVCEKDDDLKQAIWEWYDVYQFFELVGLQNGGIELVINIANKYPDYDGEPYAMISPKILIDYRTKHPHERDRMRLAMLLAISSMVGRNRFIATTKSQIAMRMFGAKNKSQLDEALKSDSIRQVYEQYTTRKMFDGLRNELLQYKLLKCYQGYAGRIYVSTRATYKQLEDDIVAYIYNLTHPKERENWKDNDKSLRAKLKNFKKGTS